MERRVYSELTQPRSGATAARDGRRWWDPLTLCLAFQSDWMWPAWSPPHASAAVTQTEPLSLHPWLGNLTSVTEWTSVIIKLSAFRFYRACNPNHGVRGVTGARLCSRWNLEPFWTAPCGKRAGGAAATHITPTYLIIYAAELLFTPTLTLLTALCFIIIQYLWEETCKCSY